MVAVYVRKPVVCNFTAHAVCMKGGGAETLPIRATNDPFFKKTSKVFVSSQKHADTATQLRYRGRWLSDKPVHQKSSFAKRTPTPESSRNITFNQRTDKTFVFICTLYATRIHKQQCLRTTHTP